jgi:hypothetical protein
MLARSLVIFGLIAVMSAGGQLGDNVAASQQKTPKEDAADNGEQTLSLLSLEVSALQGLHRFRMTPEQWESLRKLAAETGTKKEKREPGKGNDKVRKRLLDLRDALIANDDPDRITELEGKLAELLEDEKVDLDDEVKITPQAARRAAELLRKMRPSQVLAYLADFADDLTEPAQTLTNILDVAPLLNNDEWQNIYEGLIEEMTWKLGGLDAARHKAIADSVALYLKKVRGLTAEQIEAQRADLAKAAEQVAAQTPPMVVLQNFVEHALAELLSNPRLPAAVIALQEKAAAKKEAEKKETEKK